MTAILQTRGPVSTSQAIRCSWKFLRSATVQQYMAAAMELERLGFGSIVQLSGGSQKVFLKKAPGDVRGALDARPDICPVDIYVERYHCQASRTISWKVRSKLISMRLVSEKQLM